MTRAVPVEDVVVITNVVAYGDADLVVRMLTLTAGRIGAFARKARASRKRFPALWAPSLGRAMWKERASPSSDLHDLVEYDADPAVLGLAADLRGLAHASYLCELVERFVPEHEPAPPVFALVDGATRRIGKEGPSAVLLRAVELQLLLHLGYLPDVGDRLAKDAAAAARELLRLDIGAAVALPTVEPELLRATSRLFAAFLRESGGPPLRSVAFLDSVARSEGSR